MRCSIRKNLILKYERSDSGLSSLGTKSPFVCQFSINFLKYFLDDCFIPGTSENVGSLCTVLQLDSEVLFWLRI